MKRKMHLVLEDQDHRRLKALAGISGMNIGDTLHVILDRIEEKGRAVQSRLADAGLDSYAAQMPLSLGLMADSTIQSMLDNADVLKQDKGGFSGEDGFDFKAKAAEIRRREAEDDDESN